MSDANIRLKVRLGQAPGHQFVAAGAIYNAMLADKRSLNVTQRILKSGEPAPWFVCRSPGNPQFHFDSVAGRYIVLCFFGSATDPGSRRVLDDILATRQIFASVGTRMASQLCGVGNYHWCIRGAAIAVSSTPGQN